MEVRLLGPVEVAGDDGSVVTVPGQKLQLLLAALAVERGRVISPDRLVEILYGDEPPRQPLNSLQVLVSRLRRSLAAAGDGLQIETSDAGYALVAGEDTATDLERFDEIVARARTRLADDPEAAVIDLRTALDLVRGEPLAGLPGEGWARAERARFAESQLAATEARIDAELAIGGHGEVVAELEQLTRRHPLREHLWGQLMIALYRCGRQADALRAYQQARTRLVDELGIEPGSELRRLEAAILAQDPSLDPPVVVRGAVRAARTAPTSGNGAGGPLLAGPAGGSGNGSQPDGSDAPGAGPAGVTATIDLTGGGNGTDGSPAGDGRATVTVASGATAGDEPATADATADTATGRSRRTERRGTPAGRRAPGNVPRPLTPCLGRERELADILDLVGSHRLVTLVGPGGAGKTRLSVEVAHALVPAAADGVWLVDLASVRDAGGILNAVVRTLRLDEGMLAGSPAPRSLDEIAVALRDREVVLLVDNCEHVVDDVAAVVETLLALCPDLRVLATSRETLGVPGEFLFVVPPLPLDRAVELFVDRMSAGGARALGSEQDWRPLVVEICRRLDGLPLAVELAAARARHLDLAEIVDRLDQRFDLLVEGPRTAQPRQRTLRAVVDWSYDLLDPAEQRVFERLSAFSGGATLAGARAVCADGDVDPALVEVVLGRLVDKSLVGLERTPSGARYTMLQTLADYAAERLADRGDADDIVRRHAAWAREVADRACLTHPRSGHVAEVRAIQDESANLQQAIAWALDNDPLLALEMAGSLGWHWFTTMQAGLAWSVLTKALEVAGDDAPEALLSRVLTLAGLAGVLAGENERAFAMSDAAHPVEQRIGDPVRLGWFCFIRATQHVFSTEAQAAAEWLVEGRRWFTEAGDEHGLATIDYQQGVVAGLLGDLELAQGLLARAAEAHRRAGNHMTLMASLARLAEVAERDERPDDAYAAWQQLHELAVEAGVPALVSLAAAGMAFVRLDAGDAEQATALGEAAIEASREGFSPLIGGYALAAWGTAQAAFGDRRLGVERVHEAAGLFSRIGYHGGAAECWWRLSDINAGHGDCAEALRCAEAAVECASRGDDVVARRAAQARLEAARRLAG